MMIRSTVYALVFGLLAQPCLADPPRKPTDDLQPNQVANFMQAKLNHAQKLLEGLATEDYEMIEKNSQELSLLSLASTWQVFQTADYVKKSEEFRRTTNDIKKAAERKSLDGAALSYMEMTMKCIQCHKYVRSIETASLQSRIGSRTGERNEVR